MFDFLQRKFTEVFSVNKQKINCYESLQQRIDEKSAYLEQTLKIFNNFNSFTQEYQQKLLSLKISDTPHNKNDQKLHDIFSLIFTTLFENILVNQKLLVNLINEITQISNVLNKEKNYYDELKKTYNQLILEKKNAEKNKTTYHQNGQNLEKFCVNNKITDEQYLNEDLINSFESIKRELNNYRGSIIKCNLLVNEYNDKQGKILDFFPQLIEVDGVFYFRLLKTLTSTIIDKNKLNTSRLEEIKDEKYLDNDQKIKELIERLEAILQKESIIELTPFQSIIDFYKCDDENNFNIYNKIIQLLKKEIDNSIYPSYDQEAEKKKFTLNKIFTKLFSENGQVTKEQSDDLMNCLKDTSVHNIFLTLLSILRTNNRTVRSKDVVELLAKALEIILIEAEKSKNYEYAKNCIILSQTYYYLDENKKKIYVVEFLKKDPWVTTPNFWRGFIDEMIKKEFQRLQNLFPHQKMNIEKSINIPPQIIPKLNEILFSQLLPYTNNMVEFEMNKVIIVKILDEFLKKYNYLSKSNTESLFSLLTSNPEEIEKLRKEYSPELEGENNNNNKKEDEDKNEKSESKEEDKKE